MPGKLEGLTSRSIGGPMRKAFSSFIDPAEGLTEDQRQVQAVALEFAKKELSPHMSTWDAKEEFPVTVLKKSAELGFSGIYVRSEHGGTGMGRTEASLIFEALSQGCVSTAAYLSIHNMCSWMIDEFGSDEQRKRYLPDLLKMNVLSSYCLTEPNSGSDSASLTTSARLDGDHYVLNGAKAFISGAGTSDVYLVLARTGDATPKGISCFIVEKSFPGISFGQKERKMGWNSQPTRIVTLEGCRVPRANILGGEGAGFGIAMQGLAGGRVNIASCSLGAAQASLEQTLAYARDRRQFGQSLVEMPVTQFKLARMTTDILSSRLMVRHAARLLDAKSPHAAVWSSMAKWMATERCHQVCDEALQIHGGYGYLKDYPIEQFVRDTRVHRILEGTNEIMQLIIARNLLKTLN